MPIFPKPIDLAANYDWTGDHTFDGVVTCNGDFNAVNGDFSGDVTATSVIGTTNLALQSNTGASQISLASSGTVTIKAQNAIFQQFTTTGVNYRVDCVPTFDDNNSLGLTTNRWSDVFATNGSFTGSLTSEVGGSYRLYNLGDESATDSEYGIVEWDATSFNIGVGATGSGSTSRPLNLKTDSTFAVKTVSGTSKFSVSTSRVIAALDLIPNSDGVRQCGRVGARWSTVNSVDGNFSGTLTSEVGGSYKLFNLGDESATDSEFFSVSYEDNGFGANRAVLETLATGAGAGRTLALRAANNIIDIRSDVDYMMRLRKNFGIACNEDVIPNANDARKLGTDTTRWSDVYGVDGDFSGTLKTEGFKTGVAATTQAAITLSDTDHTLLADCTSNNVVVSLPASAGNDGLQYTIKKVDGSANYCSVTPNGAETIDGQSGLTITGQYESVNLVCYSGEWYLV
jgi:hypothetical protein